MTLAGDVFQPIFASWFGEDSILANRRYAYSNSLSTGPEALNELKIIGVPLRCLHPEMIIFIFVPNMRSGAKFIVIDDL